jgi:transcriptional regulator with XRE-family HTH domain
MQLADRLRRELAQYVIGPKLKSLRLRRSMGLQQLGERSGLSPSLLSRVENGKHLPTVPTLLRIAQVFDVTLDHFFRNEKRQRIVALTRKEEREQAHACDPAWSEGCFLSKLDLGLGERKFHPYLAEFALSKSTRPHAHEGVEFVHVLVGALGLLIGTEESILTPGDSIYFDSSLRHSYRGLSRGPCMALMVCSDAGRNLAERRMDRLQDLRVVGRQSQASRVSAWASSSVDPRRAEQTIVRNVGERGKLPARALSHSAITRHPVGTRLGLLQGHANGNRHSGIASDHAPAPSKNRKAIQKSARSVPLSKNSSSKPKTKRKV